MRTTVLLRGSTAPLVADARAGLGFHPAPDAQPGVHVTHEGTGQYVLGGGIRPSGPCPVDHQAGWRIAHGAPRLVARDEVVGRISGPQSRSARRWQTDFSRRWGCT